MSCPVCFNAGIADDTVRTSMNLGIGVLLAVTAVVLAGFVRFIASIARRSTKADLPFDAAQGTPSRGRGVNVGLYDPTASPAAAASSTLVEAGLQTGFEI